MTIDGYELREVPSLKGHMFATRCGRLYSPEYKGVRTDGRRYFRAARWRRCVPNNQGYETVCVSILSEGIKTTTKVHRLIAEAWVDGWAPHLMVDHINGNKSDNRASNLRMATAVGNAHNRPMKNSNVSGYRGVHLRQKEYRDTKKWQSRIVHKGKAYHLGFFDDPMEAAKAYDIKAVELLGSFANTNFD